MNNIIKGISFLFGYLCMTSCSDLTFGNEFLGEQPESSGATTEMMFANKENADKVLTKAYTGLIYGISTTAGNRLGGNVAESITDLCQSYRDNAGDGPSNLYYNGKMSPNDVDSRAAYLFGGQSDWTTIRYAWMYIENVDKVPNYSDAEKNRRVAEAKTLIALSYFRMMRYIGGVPWIDHAVEANETLNYPRLTFSKTVQNIVALLDEAIPYLLWKEDDQNEGRMTKAGAMALKFQVLLWAASPTFNSTEKWHPEADEYTCYGDFSQERWKAAETAASNFFSELSSQRQYELVQPEEETHRARRLAYRKAYFERGNTEILISIRKGYAPSTHQPYIDQHLYSGPTLNYVDMFPWADGTDFPEIFDWKNPSKQPFFTGSDPLDPEPTRDPRLYENVVCPGDKYLDGTIAPVFTNSSNYRAGTGFRIMKFILQESADRTGPVQWPFLRLSEVMLGYAEVLNETSSKPSTLAKQMINNVRARVGLSALPDNLDQSQFREAVIKERALELGFEEVRWFDLVRRDREADFKKTLYGLRSKGIGGENIYTPASYTFEKVPLDRIREWSKNWNTKWYLVPIPQNEINKKYGMTQNPGW